MNNTKFIAIIPTRSGSKGFKNKTINIFLNTSLLVQSINFAKKLKFIENSKKNEKNITLFKVLKY